MIISEAMESHVRKVSFEGDDEGSAGRDKGVFEDESRQQGIRAKKCSKKRRKSHKKIENVKYKRRESNHDVGTLTGCTFEGEQDACQGDFIDKVMHKFAENSGTSNEEDLLKTSENLAEKFIFEADANVDKESHSILSNALDRIQLGSEGDCTAKDKKGSVRNGKGGKVLSSLRQIDKFSEDYTDIRPIDNYGHKINDMPTDKIQELTNQSDIMTGFTLNDALDYAVNSNAHDTTNGSCTLKTVFHLTLYRIFIFSQVLFGMTLGMIFVIPNMIQCESFHADVSPPLQSLELISNSQKLIIPLQFFLGYGVGVYLLGVLADRYGRNRFVILLSVSPCLVCTLCLVLSLALDTSSNASPCFGVILFCFFILGFYISGHHVLGNLFDEFFPLRNCYGTIGTMSMKQRHFMFAVSSTGFGGAIEVLLTILVAHYDLGWECLLLFTIAPHMLLLLSLYICEGWIRYKYSDRYRCNLSLMKNESDDVGEDNSESAKSIPLYMKLLFFYFQSPLPESPLYLLVCGRMEEASKILKEAVKVSAFNQLIFTAASRGTLVPSSYTILGSKLVNTEHVMCHSEDFTSPIPFSSLFSKFHPRGGFLALLRGQLSFNSVASTFDQHTENALRYQIRKKCLFMIIYGIFVVFSFVFVSILSTQFLVGKTANESKESSFDGIFCEQSRQHLVWNVDGKTYLYMGTASLVQILCNYLSMLYVPYLGPARGSSLLLFLGSLTLFYLFIFGEWGDDQSKSSLSAMYLSISFTYSSFSLWWVLGYSLQFPSHVRVSGFGFVAGVSIVIGSFVGLAASKIVFDSSDFRYCKYWILLLCYRV